MKDQGRGPATYVVPWAPHLLNWALSVGNFGVNDVKISSEKEPIIISGADPGSCFNNTTDRATDHSAMDK